MSWLKVDDNFLGHPKVLRAATIVGDHGLGRVLVVWHQGQAHATKYLTDGALCREVVARFHDDPAPLEVADALVTVGLWEHTDAGFLIHDYLDYNASADDIRHFRQTKAAAGRLGGRISAEQRASKRPSTPQAPASRMLQQLPKHTASSRARDPKPIPSDPKEHVRGAEAPEGDGFEDFWQAYPKHKAKPEAQKAWKALKPSRQLQALILEALTRQRTWPSWTKDGGQFVPYPATWLRRQGWDDEPDRPARDPPDPGRFDWWRECQHEPRCETQPMHTQRVALDAARKKQETA